MDYKPGITYVEVLTGLAVMAVLGIMIASVYLAHFRLFSVQSTNIDIANQNTIAIDEMANQIREATSILSNCAAYQCVPNCNFGNPSCSNPPSYVTSDKRLIMWVWPLNSSGEPTQPPSPLAQPYPDFISYFLEDQPNGSKNLIKWIGKMTEGSPPGSYRNEISKIIASGVDYTAGTSTPVFRYYDATGAEINPATQLASIPNTTKVVITLTTAGQTIRQPSKTKYTQTRTVILRNKQY